MKTIHLRRATARHATLVLILFLTAQSLWAQPATPLPPGQGRPRPRAATNNPAGAISALPTTTGSNAPAAGAPASGGTTARSGMSMAPLGAADSSDDTGGTNAEGNGIVFEYDGVDVNQVLDVYSDLVGRTLIRGTVPQASIILITKSPLTKAEAIEALQAVLALNNITFVNIGEKFVKVVTPEQAASAGGTVDTNDLASLQEMGPYVTRVVQLEHIKPSAVVPLIASFGKLANNLFPIDDNGILVMRDYTENVKRMMEMIARIDISVPAVYISEVIPIRYAQVDEIASALNSLGGSGGGTISVGTSTSASPISGMAPNRNGTTGTTLGGLGANQPGGSGINGTTSPLGTPRPATATTSNPNGTPSGSTSSLQSRLLNMVTLASGGGSTPGKQEPIQIFGQAKIIADVRANALLVYATKDDMKQIKEVIGKLDVLLSQVLIEAVIIDYELGPNTLSVGVSAAQSPQTYSPSLPASGAGGFNNGQSFYNFATKVLGGGSTNTTTTTTSGSAFGNGLPGGLSYFQNIGPNWNVALQAAAADSHASVIQRPRIQTSQAKPAQFFVGETVPYITSFGNYGYGNQSSYSQLSVGIELDVTPFINPDGLVVMDVQQEIDDIIPNGGVNINGTSVPSTTKRTLNSEIAVRDRDTVMLGGFIKNAKSSGRTGVPILQDIPLLGNLFSQRSSSKQREELIVLMRPTVLKTPFVAATNTIIEGQRLAGVSASLAEDSEEQSKSVEVERKKELKNPKTMSAGFFNTPIPTNPPAEELPQPQVPGDSFFTPVPPPSAPVIPADTTPAAPVIP
jgi:general secretion pathway protein D